mmetsp:Transcript_3293/g.5972  ORF Transcript_3293/g.5972 Transcript_3293/m.5972 type:complete len:779 (+) Transcript_3293:183-2519(+)
MSGPEECGAVQQTPTDHNAPSCCHPSPTVSTAASPEPIVSSRESSGGGPSMSPRARSASPHWVSDDDASTDIRRGTRVRPGSQCSSEERACDSPRSGSSSPASPRQQHQCFLASGSQLSESGWLGEHFKQSSWLLDGFSNAPTPVDTGSPPVTARALSKMAAASSAAQPSEAGEGEETTADMEDEGDDVWPVWQCRSTDPDIATAFAGTWARSSANEDTDGWLSAGPVRATSRFLSNSNFLSSDLAEENMKSLEGEDFSDQTMDWLVSDALGDEPVTVPDELSELLSSMGVTSHAGGDPASQAANADLLVQELLRICPELDLEVAAGAESAHAEQEPAAATEEPASAEPANAAATEELANAEEEPAKAEEEPALAVPPEEKVEEAPVLAPVAENPEPPTESTDVALGTAAKESDTEEQEQPIATQGDGTEASWEERFLQALSADFGGEFNQFVSTPGSKEFDSMDNESSLEERIVAALDLLGRSALDTKDPSPTDGSSLEPAFNPPPESGAGYEPIKLDQHENILTAFEPREECPKMHARTQPRRSRQSSRKSKEGDGKTADGLSHMHRKKKKAMASLPQLGGETEDEEKMALHAKRAGRKALHNSISPPPMYQPYRRSAMEEDLLSQEASYYDAEAKEICYKSQRIPYSGSLTGSGQRLLSAKLTASGSPREKQWSASASPGQRLYKTSRLAVKPPGLLPDIKAPSAGALVQSGLATVLGQSLSAPALPTCGKVMPGGLASYSSKAAHGFYEKKYRCGGHELLHILKEGRLPQMMCR